MVYKGTSRRLLAFVLMFVLTIGNVAFGASRENDTAQAGQTQEKEVQGVIEEINLEDEEKEIVSSDDGEDFFEESLEKEESEETVQQIEEAGQTEEVQEEVQSEEIQPEILGVNPILDSIFSTVQELDLSDSAINTGNVVTITDGGVYTVVDSVGVTNVRLAVNTTEPVTLILQDIEISTNNGGALIIADYGDVTILLPDGTNNILDSSASMSAAGINVPPNASLTIGIPDGDEGTGILEIFSIHGAGIGGVAGQSAGTIVIEAGVIKIVGVVKPNEASFGAGIGGGGDSAAKGGDGGNITITGDAVLEITSQAGAGIGGGYSINGGGGEGGNITIGGNAKIHITPSSERGTGIGGGSSAWAPAGNGGIITIKGNADITIEVLNLAAGIGSGCTSKATVGADAGLITIGGNAKVFVSHYHGAGIGGGSGSTAAGMAGNGGIINIVDNAQVTTKSIHSVATGAGIGGGGSFTTTNKSGDGGIITIDNNAVVNIEQIGRGAGIGGGGGGYLNQPSNSGTISIKGHSEVYVEAVDGAGIGGGYSSQGGGDGGFLTISENAKVYAKSAMSSGIGGGHSNSFNGPGTGGGGGTVILQDNAEVTAIGGTFCSGIGGAVGAKPGSNWSNEKDLSQLESATFGQPADLTVAPGVVLTAYSRVGYALHTVNNEISGGANVVNLYFWNDGNETEPASTLDDVSIIGVSADRNHVFTLTLPPNYTGFAFSGNSESYKLITEEDTPRSIVYRSDLSSDLLSSDTFAVPLEVTFSQPEAYTVSYNANGAEGTVPQDVNTYYLGGEAAVMAGTGLTLDGYEFKGWTDNEDGTGRVYTAGDKYLMNRDVTFYALWETEKAYTITYSANGGTGTPPADTKVYKAGEDAVVLDNSGLTRDKYTFEGWTLNSGGTGTVYKAGDLYTVNGDVVFYANWKSDSAETPGGSSSGGGGGSVTKKDQFTVTFLMNDTLDNVYMEKVVDEGSAVAQPANPSRENYVFTGWFKEKDCLEKYDFTAIVSADIFLYAGWEPIEYQMFTDDHFAYIAGYPDGTIRPEDNITRAEVASILYRLLDEDYRASVYSTSSIFSDVPIDAWYGESIATMTNAGVLDGYPDGLFKPGNNITRGEFAKVVSIFAGGDYNGGNKFNDIDGHWAAQFINLASEKGWIEGYPGGTYRPDSFITRAEAVAIINRILDRNPGSIDDLLEGMTDWPDNSDTAKWYYIDIQEASNSHTYERDSNVEKWVELN